MPCYNFVTSFTTAQHGGKKLVAIWLALDDCKMKYRHLNGNAKTQMLAGCAGRLPLQKPGIAVFLHVDRALDMLGLSDHYYNAEGSGEDTTNNVDVTHDGQLSIPHLLSWEPGNLQTSCSCRDTLSSASRD